MPSVYNSDSSDTVILISSTTPGQKRTSDDYRDRDHRERSEERSFKTQRPLHPSTARFLNSRASKNKGKLSASINGTSNYWKRSRSSWICLFFIVLAIIWFWHWFTERQKRLRIEEYLERAGELDLMIKTMESHISSAQQKLVEVKQLQNPKGI